MTGTELFLFQLGAISLGLALGTLLDSNLPRPRYWYLLPLFLLLSGPIDIAIIMAAEQPWSWLQLAIPGQYMLAGAILLFTRRRWAPPPQDQ